MFIVALLTKGIIRGRSIILSYNVVVVVWLKIYHYSIECSTGKKLKFTVPGHLPKILHFISILVTFPFKG